MYKTIFTLLLWSSFNLIAQSYGDKKINNQYIGFIDLTPKGDGTYNYNKQLLAELNYKKTEDGINYGVELLDTKNYKKLLSGELLEEGYFPSLSILKEDDSKNIILYYNDMFFVLKDYNNNDYKSISNVFFRQCSKKTNIISDFNKLNIDNLVRMYLNIIERRKKSYVLTKEDEKYRQILKKNKS